VSTRGATAPHPPKPDRDIQTEVLHELNRNALLAPAEVGVEVSGGVVTLTGTVSGHDKVDAAACAAVSVPGVHDVANKLVVDGDDGEHDATKIAHAIRHALGWNTAVPADQIDVITCRGVVTLRGTVRHWYERRSAEDTVAAVPGVVSVNNQIHLLVAPADDDVLREEVEDALTHVPSCDRVLVTVAKGVVTLAGDVGSTAIRQHAYTVAAAAPGVRSVVDRLLLPNDPNR
jgi:osmotically-inducible protein OsmY